MGPTAKDVAGEESSDAVIERTVKRVYKTLDNVDRVVGDGNSVSSAIATATAPQPPAAPWHVWVCVTSAVLSVMAALLALQSAWGTSQRVTDLRVDMQAERLSREQMDNWTAQEVTAIRSYITNGKLVPMQPRPSKEPQK